MKANYWILFWLISVAFWGCASFPPQNNPVDSDSGSDCDILRAGTLFSGFNYRKNWEKAKHHDAAALHALFRFTDSDGFAGALAEDHSRLLHGLLHLWGDRPFAQELGKEKPRIRTFVLWALDTSYDPDWNSRKFPATYGLVKHHELRCLHQ